MTEQKHTKYQTAHWTGIIRPDLSSPNELIALSIRLPKRLADDVALATYEYRSLFDSDEELIATAISWALQSLAEDPPPIPRPKRLPPYSSVKARSNEKRPRNT